MYDLGKGERRGAPCCVCALLLSSTPSSAEQFTVEGCQCEGAIWLLVPRRHFLDTDTELTLYSTEERRDS